MLTENRTAFLTALRSGRFVQIFGEWLDNDDESHCCAGGVAISLSPNSRELGVTQAGSQIVMDFLDVDQHFLVDMIRLNDEKKTFDQIADWAEGQWTDESLSGSPTG